MKRANRKDELVIMAYDPSLTGWGWVVVKIDGTVLSCGCIKTGSENKVRRIRKGDDDVRRIAEINHALLRRIRRHRVNYLLSELPHGSQSSAAAKTVGITAAVGQTLAQALDIPIEWYSEGDSKKALLGKTTGTKQETIDEIANHYIIPRTGKWKKDAPWSGIKYRDEAVADAMSIFHTALQQSTFLQFYKNQNR